MVTLRAGTYQTLGVFLRRLTREKHVFVILKYQEAQEAIKQIKRNSLTRYPANELFFDMTDQ